jgi:hypothetical protein
MRWFEYARLPFNEENRNFRLLEILPGHGDDIVCKLKHTSLDEKPKYETISYCWGDCKAAKPIQCNEALLNIPDSLYFALQQFRYRKEIRTLWADAICINQKDPDEKSTQIPLMSDIYCNALGVLIWLGRESHDSALAMSFISQLYPTMEDAAQPLANPLADLNPAERRAWHAVSNLLGRPWFRRVWVIQEVAVASKVVLYCGSSFLLWDTLVDVCQNTCKSVTSMKLSPFGLGAVLFLGKIRRKTIEGDKFGLLQALLMTRSFHASDPRDKLYAIYGLTKDSNSQHLNIQANYRLSPEDVFKTFAITILQRHRNLDLLSVPRSSQDSELKQLPSWTPDWTTTTSNAGCRRLHDDYEYIFFFPDFQATRGSEYTPTFSRNGALAVLSGELVDEITLLGPKLLSDLAWPNSGSSEKEVKNWFQSHYKNLVEWYNIILVGQSKRYITGEDMANVFYQTLLGGYGSGTEDLARVAACFRVWRLMRRLRCHGSIWAHAMAKWLIGYLHNGIWGSSDAQEDYYRCFYDLNLGVGGRRIMRTRNGYMGTVPSQAELGDKVGLFKGGKVPLIIRPKDDCWELVGDSYIHGMMFGELFNENNCQIIWLS